MRSPNDPLIDELRGREGNLFGRAPAQEWVKPETVILREKTFRHVMEGSLKEGSELEFVIPWSAQPARCVRPSKDMLEGFLCLAVASNTEIHKFASKFGPLLIFCRVKECDDHAVIVESCEVWRYFSACMKSLLHMAASFQSGLSARSADWDVIGSCPMAVARTAVENYDWLNPSPIQQEKSWKVMASIIRGRRNRDRAMWARLLNSLLGLGRVRPWVNLDGSGASARAQLTFTGPNLLSYLALHLCLAASKHDEFAVCSHCNQEYSPTQRAPKAGQRNFCPDCRANRVPVRIAQRSRRERLREKTNGLTR
jgi:hypothetical protein